MLVSPCHRFVHVFGLWSISRFWICTMVLMWHTPVRVLVHYKKWDQRSVFQSDRQSQTMCKFRLQQCTICISNSCHVAQYCNRDSAVNTQHGGTLDGYHRTYQFWLLPGMVWFPLSPICGQKPGASFGAQRALPKNMSSFIAFLLKGVPVVAPACNEILVNNVTNKNESSWHILQEWVIFIRWHALLS